MIEVENLTKYYGGFQALRDVTFNVEQGEILGFLGPNGAGKTTTMRIVTGYIPATSGTVRVAGFDIAEKSLQARQNLGYLPETVPLYPELTPYEYLDFKGRISGMHNGRERKARVHEVLDELNLVDVAGKLIGSLSRGYRQRVGLAQALLHNPSCLILDEPTVGLDPVQITEVRDLIKDLGKNHTVILSTHLLPEVSMVCNRVIIINRGRLVAIDTPIHLTESAQDEQTVVVEASGAPEQILGLLRSVSGVQKAAVSHGSSASVESEGQFEVHGSAGIDIRPRVANALVQAGVPLLEMRIVRPSLEDIFIRVISQEEEQTYENEDTIDEPEPSLESEPAARVRPTLTTKRRVRK